MAASSEVEREVNRLVRTYSDDILRLSYTYLGSRTDAEDVCQEVLLRLLRRGGGFENADHERAWIMRVTANYCKDVLRRRSSHATVDLDSVPEPVAAQAPDERDVMRRSDSVVAAVMQLPLKYREAIFLFYFKGLPIREIAQVAGASEASISQRLSRGRAKLRTLLSEEDFDERVG